MKTDCAVFKVVGFASKKWSVLILHEIYKGDKFKRRYSEIKRALPGITPKVLSARLRELEKNKLIERIVDAKSMPVRSDYVLTERGKDFVRVIKELKSWGIKWDYGNEHCRETTCKACGF